MREESLPLDRRKFVALAAGGLVSGLTPSAAIAATSARRGMRIKAIAFDAFPIFDPRPVSALVKELFPVQGDDLSAEWRTRQFEYAWLRSLSGNYADFWQITEEALAFAAHRFKLELTVQIRDRLMQSYLQMDLWPEVSTALAAFREAGIRLALLSNLTGAMLSANIDHNGLNGVFEHVLSTDRTKTYKPDPRAYQLGINAFRLQRQEILFVAFAGWDAYGAKLYGYPTCWINRQGLPPEELGQTVDMAANDLTGMVKFVTNAIAKARVG